MKRNWSYTIKDGEHAGVTLWSGRYVCTVAAVFRFAEDGNIFVLANKRGVGSPNEVGKWNMPCGFMEVETGEECASRETFEECGIKVNPNKFHLVSVNTDPTDNPTQVTLRYMAILFDGFDDVNIDTTDAIAGKLGGEKDEVADVQWIPIEDVKNHDWAFGHKKLIDTIINDESTMAKVRH